MPLCAKCHQNEATVHLTMVVDGAEEEAVHLCKECAPFAGFNTLDLKELEALSVMGKKCEFCGKDAFSGEMVAGGGAIYWCFDCGLELGGILADLVRSERPDLKEQGKGESSLLSIYCDPELQKWSEAANQKALQRLKERRRQDGRDKGG